MAIFFQSRIADDTIASFESAIARAAALPATASPSKVLELSSEALSHAATEEKLDWKRVWFVLLFLSILICGGLAEYHLGSSTISEKLFSWAERLFILVIGIIGGEASTRRS